MSEIVTGKRGIRYRLIGQRDLISQYIRLHGEYEPELQLVSAHILAGRQGHVIDAGANLGSYSIPLARQFPQIEIIAFEPQRTIYRQLVENIELNDATNVLPVHLGLSDREADVATTVPHYETESNIGAFSLDEEVRQNQYEVKTAGGEETIRLVPLDTFEFANVRLIKIDVEGMELKVLAGATETLRASHYPPILFEAWAAASWFEERRQKLYRYLEDMGYKVMQFGNNNIAQHVSRDDYRHFQFEAIEANGIVNGPT
jgi:FkbM family methyltransferase